MVSIATAIKKTVVPDFGLWLASRMISHVKFVSIPTRDQDRAVKFWTERAGFRVFTDQPFNEKQRWIELRIGSSETRVVLFNFGEQGAQPGTPFNGALACDNVEQTY